MLVHIPHHVLECVVVGIFEEAVYLVDVYYIIFDGFVLQGGQFADIIDATGQVTKVGIETAGNVVGTLGTSVVKVVTGQSGKEPSSEEYKEKMKSE